MAASRSKSARQVRASSTKQGTRAGKRGAQSKAWDRYANPPRRGGAQLPLGAHPWNTGGKKGRSGRKPDAFKEMCRQLASSDIVWQSVQLILLNENHPNFNGALKWATENGYGKPVQKLDVKASAMSPGKLTKDEMKAELAKLFSKET